MNNLNNESWELAEVGMVVEKGKPASFSTKQIRNILTTLKEKGLNFCLNMCENYNPSGVRDVNKKQHKNKEFLKKLKELASTKSKDDAVKLMRLVIFNLYNISNIKDKRLARLLLDVEDVDENIKEKILNKYKEKPMKKNNGFNKSRSIRRSNYRNHSYGGYKR
jgi:hypothetical protein